MDFAITKVSSKGQIVIPNILRENIKKGDEFLMIKDDGRLILKNLRAVAQDLKEDLKFAESVEKAWLEHDKGEFITKSKKEFLKELESCR